MHESVTPPEDSWIQEMDADNFLAILDVLLDIEQELNIASDDIEIPLLRTVVRFSQLLPGDGINMRDRYCELRWKAVGFLKKIAVIRGFDLIRGMHRWDSRLAIMMDGSNVARVRQLVQRMQEDYKRRVVRPKPAVSSPTDAGDALQKVRLVLTRFHHVATRLRQRHSGRPTLDVADEHDAHDLLHALLVVFFDDVRLEEWTPSYAGKSSRVDFFLKPEGIVIEVKKTRPGLGEKEIGDQLIIDVDRYRQCPGVRLYSASCTIPTTAYPIPGASSRTSHALMRGSWLRSWSCRNATEVADSWVLLGCQPCRNCGERFQPAPSTRRRLHIRALTRNRGIGELIAATRGRAKLGGKALAGH